MCVVAQGCHCNATVVGSIPTRKNELLFINIFVSPLWHLALEFESLGLSSAIQHEIPQKKNIGGGGGKKK